MSKFTIFVGVYSVIMLALFFTFCFLMTRVNPPQVKQDPEHSKRFGPEDLIYSDEFLPNDNVAYGLEKVNDDFDSIDVFAKTISQNRRMPTLYIGKNYKTNYTSKGLVKVVTRSMKHIKGLRRSINNENQQEDAIPRSVHLKIKDLNGRPRIEIKLVPEKSRNKKFRTYRSSANITNNTRKFYNDNITRYVYDNISKEVIVVIENNEKLVLDFARDSINLYDDNTYNKDELLNDKNISETNNNIYNDLLILNTSKIQENISKKVMMNASESNQTDFKKTTLMIKGGKNEVKSTEVLFNTGSCNETITKKELTQNSTKVFNETTQLHITSDDRKREETTPLINIAVNTLVGLLIPEATATLPFNYHFIN